jgi:putative transposase
MYYGLVFTRGSDTALVQGYELRQEFITPHSPEQNGMVERVIRTLKDQCVHRHRLEMLRDACRVIGDWIRTTADLISHWGWERPLRFQK